MRAQVDDRICDELARPMERSLPATHGFYEGGAPIGAEVVLLLCGYRSNFSAPAGVHGIEFGGYDMRRRSWEVGWRFRREEARDEGFLKVCSGGIGDDRGEVEVDEGPHWACLKVLSVHLACDGSEELYGSVSGSFRPDRHMDRAYR